jgi:hypothetical protein
MSHRSILLSLAAAAVCALALLPSAGAQAGGRTQTLRFFDQPVSITLTRGGKVFDRAPYPQAKPGDVLDVNSLDYVGTHASHAKQWTASSHLQCRFGAAGPPSCVSHVAIGGSLLVFSGNPGKLVNGTGIYQRASGRTISAKEVPGMNDASDIVVRIRLAA